MSAEAPPPRPRRHALLAVALLFFLVVLALLTLTSPLRHALALRAEAEQRLERYEATLSQPAPEASEYDPADLAVVRPDEAAVQLELQALLDSHARAAGLAVQAVSPAGAEPLGELGRIVWIEATLAGDLQSVADLLARLDAERPLLLVRAFDVAAGAPLFPDRSLSIRLELGRAWRAGAAPP